MKILLFGANGQVGWELQRSLAPLGILVALDRHGQNGLCGDLTNFTGIAETVKKARPDVIVNAAAYTAVDRAEVEQEQARVINTQAPAVLALEANAIGALLVHYSTDYVFDGSGNRPWKEGDSPAPLNVYGQTKLGGEAAIREAGCRHLIFRTSWVYAARGHNFLRTILQLAQEREALKVVGDQVGAPTSAELIADVTAHAISSAARETAPIGTYHLAAAGEASWYDYTRFALGAALDAGLLLKATPETTYLIPSSGYPTPAPRPRNSRLNTDELERAFALRMPPWQQGVARVVAELLDPSLKRGIRA